MLYFGELSQLPTVDTLGPVPQAPICVHVDSSGNVRLTRIDQLHVYMINVWSNIYLKEQTQPYE